VWERGVRGVQQPQHVRVDHALPLLHGRVLDRAQQHHACVRHHRVQPSELCKGLLDRTPRSRLVGDVGLEHGRLRAVGLKPFRQLDQPVSPSRDDRDPGAAGCQLDRRRFADAAARARDQCDSSFQ
jgi:hypothetical protein